MLFKTPQLGPDEERVLEEVRQCWRLLRVGLIDRPYRWAGLLRRSAFARALQGSNSIEGYTVSQDDALAAAAGEEPFDADAISWTAVSNYRDAMTYVLQLASDPFFKYDASLLRSLHFMMLRHDLPRHPGSWRPGAVYVRDDARGVVVYEGPPAQDVPKLMDEFVAWLPKEEDASPMIRAAMAHLNLAMIHPFSDGNGRMARCLQTLVLSRAGVLDPAFCSVEEYLGRNTDDYYRVCAEVGGGSWQPQRDARPWIRFMLTAHFRQAKTLMRRNEETAAVWADVEGEVARRKLPERAITSLVNAAFGRRIRNTAYRADADVSQLVASRDLRAASDAGLLVPQGEKRGRYYVAAPELKAIRDRHRSKEPIPDPFEKVAR